jgi:alpha-L-arabinofuranosidase
VTAAFVEASSELILKLVNATAKESSSKVEVTGVRGVGRGTLTVLRGEELETVNTLDAPSRVAPEESAFSASGPAFDLTLRPNSLTVLRVAVVK